MPRYIDADALVAELQKKPIHDGHFIHTRDVSDAIFNAPTISPDEVRGAGEWIKLGAHKGMEQYKCSVCETPTYVPECMNDPMYGYCPNCGAKMKGADDETTDNT